MTVFELMEDIGINIEHFLNERGMKQKQLADKVGVSKSTISAYINGERLPSIVTLINICYALDCEIEDLIILYGDEIE